MKAGDKYKVKSEEDLRILMPKIEELNDLLDSRGILSFYDPDETWPTEYTIDDITEALVYMANAEIEILDKNKWIVPMGIVMITGFWGTGGINDEMLSLIATKTDAPPKFNLCSHKNKYLNRLSRTLEFWYCPDCKQEV